MKISTVFSNNIYNQRYNNNLNNFDKSFVYNRMFSFRGSQTKPLTDEDFLKAQKRLPKIIQDAKKKLPDDYVLNLDDLDLKKINGLQKDIKVFDGLTMQEIAFVLTNTALLLNRGCSNLCSHCGVMATPITSQTYDRMSFEDFKSFVDGVSELQKRCGSDVSVLPGIQPFFDSDCINIEIKDKNNKTYDYIDCVDYMFKNGFPEMLLDTSGWNPRSEKMQKRAEKFVDYLLKMDNPSKIDINISINPYHIYVTEAVKARVNGDFDRATELENKYAERIANVLFTFTPLLNKGFDIEILSRAIPKENCINDCNFNKLLELELKIISHLNEMYACDLQTDKKVIKSSEDFMINSLNFAHLMKESLEEGRNTVIPMGRARSLIINPQFTFRQNKDFFDLLLKQRDLSDISRAINPNGSVVLNRNDLSAKTSVQLNFENKDKNVKKLCVEKENFVYKV